MISNWRLTNRVSPICWCLGLRVACANPDAEQGKLRRWVVIAANVRDQAIKVRGKIYVRPTRPQVSSRRCSNPTMALT